MYEVRFNFQFILLALQLFQLFGFIGFFTFWKFYFLKLFFVNLHKIMSRRSWSEKEDQAVTALVQKFGTKNWSSLAYQLHHVYKFKERSGKQCRQRYHNHLDPRIQKKVWTLDEETILFNMHKKYGNKWTSIAEHLQGRTDNTIKNHFYSTIRRSLRRMSKLIGSKNSTKQMKYIKPSTLSKIFAINIKPTTEEEIQEENRKCQENKAYQQLINFIKDNCNDLTDVILEFSNFKPKGKNCVLPEQERGTFQEVLQKLTILNEIYQKMRKQQKKLNVKFNMIIDQSSSESDSENHSSESMPKTTKVTRSKREIKPPKKFQEKISKPIRKQRKSIVLKKDTSIIMREIQDKSVSDLQKMDMKRFESEKLPDFGFDPARQHHFEINLKEKQENQYQYGGFPPSNAQITFTPNYFFNTPRLQFQSPNNINISAASRVGIFARPFEHHNWNVSANELEDIANNITKQIAKNQQSEGREDGRTSSSSNINYSPHSAFKSVQ